MSGDLVKEIPLEKREIVYIVEDPGQRAFFYMEGESVPANCTLVTKDEISDFDHSLTDLAKENTILLWNDFESKYQPQEDYSDDQRLLDVFSSFCFNYLGASKVYVDSEDIINTESNSKTKVGVSGKLTPPVSEEGGTGDNGNGDDTEGKTKESKSAEAGIDVNVENDTAGISEAKRHDEAYSWNPPPFDIKKATKYYKAKGLYRYRLFEKVYEDRVNHPKGGFSRDYEESIMEERKKRFDCAVDICAKINKVLNVNIGIARESQSKMYSFRKRKFKVVYK